MLKKAPSVASVISAELQGLQRERQCLLKSRLMHENRRRAYVATVKGYHAGQDEESRKEQFVAAQKLIDKILKEGPGADRLDFIVMNLSQALNPLAESIKSIEAGMKKLASQLPVADWAKEVKGFGVLGLAKIVGETGDLDNYANPAKVWRRMGCAPFDGHAGKTWKIPKWRPRALAAEEWETFGYCGRRRSIMYVIAEGLVKQNDGVYRARYDEAKANGLLKWPEHVSKAGTSIHAHSHAMLLCGKLLLKNLWIEWTQ